MKASRRVDVAVYPTGMVGIAILAMAAILTGAASTLAAARCGFDVDGDAVVDLELRDADGDGACEFPPGATVIRGVLHVARGTTIEFRGTTTITADAIEIADGGGLRADPGQTRSLTIITRRDGMTLGGTVDLRVRDDLLLRALRGEVVVGPGARLGAGDRLTIDVRHGGILWRGAGATRDDGTAGRLELLTPGTRGGIELAGVRLTAGQVKLSARTATAAPSGKDVRVTAGSRIVIDPQRAAGDVVMNASGDVLVDGGSLLAATRSVRFLTARRGDDLCIGSALVTAQTRSGPGRIELTAVRGLAQADDAAQLQGLVVGTLDTGSCADAAPTTTTTTVTTSTTASASTTTRAASTSTVATTTTQTSTTGRPSSSTTTPGSNPGSTATSSTTTATTLTPPAPEASDFGVTTDGVAMTPTQRGGEIPLEFTVRNVGGRPLGRVPFTVRFFAPEGAKVRIDPGTGVQEFQTIFSSNTAKIVRVKVLTDEDLSPGEYPITAVFEFGRFTIRAVGIVLALASSSELKVQAVIDANNDDGVGTPKGDEADTKIKDDADKPGKYVPVNDDDDDADALMDLGDGFDRDDKPDTLDNLTKNENDFVPLVVTVPNGIDFKKAQLVIGYQAPSDPAGTKVEGTAQVVTPATGRIRLWRKTGDVVRKGHSVSGTPEGDYVPPGKHAVGKFGLDADHRTVKLWIEGIRPSTKIGEERITVAIDPDGAGSAPPAGEDAVRATVLGIDVAIDSDNDNATDTPGKTPVENAIEGNPGSDAFPGKMLAVNDDSDDGDNVLDYGDGFDLDASGTVNADDENLLEADFIPFTVTVPAAFSLDKGTLTFSYKGSNPKEATIVDGDGTTPPGIKPAVGRLRIWRKGGREKRSRKPVGTDDGDWVVPDKAYGRFDFAKLGFVEGKREVTLYVEGIAASPGAGGDDLTVAFDPDGDDGKALVHQDVVRLTSVKVDVQEDTNQKYGFDEFTLPLVPKLVRAQAALEPRRQPVPPFDFVSVRREETVATGESPNTTTIKVVLSPLVKDRIHFVIPASGRTVAKAEPATAADATQTVKITGLASGDKKANTTLEVHVGAATGPLATIADVRVYEQNTVPKVFFYRVIDTGSQPGKCVDGTKPCKRASAATDCAGQKRPDGTADTTCTSVTVTPKIRLADLRGEMNKVYRQAVVHIVDVKGSDELDLRWDVNDNGILDKYNGGSDPEFAFVKARLPDPQPGTAPSIIAVDKLRWNWRLTADAAANSKKLKLESVSGIAKGQPLWLGTPDQAQADAEKVTIEDIDASAKTVTLVAGPAKEYKKTSTAKNLLFRGLAGLSTTPQLVTNDGGELIETTIHEMLHKDAFGALSDLAEQDNVMFYTVGAKKPVKLRQRPQTIVKLSNPTDGTETQWHMIKRP